MARPSPEQLVDIILMRREVYSLEVDSLIRQAANRLTTRAFFEVIEKLGDNSGDLASEFARLLDEFGGEGETYMISFDTGTVPVCDEELATPSPVEEPAEYYLKLVFDNEDAAYYQFSLFPDLEIDYVLGAARKRSGAVQHIHITLASPDALQLFIESCRSNPHFVRVEQSTADEFRQAPSNAV